MHFTSHYSTPHHIKRFHITHHSMPKDFTSHHLSCHTIPHHTTIAQHSTSHYYIPMSHATSRTLCWNTSHLGPPYFQYLRSHYTAVCLGTTISRHHISKHMFHIHISHHPIYTTIPHHTHIQHHSIFHTTPYSTFITPPHLTSQDIESFSTSDITQQSHSALHIPHSSPPQFHTTTFTWRNFPLMQHSTYIALCNIPHNRTPHSTPRHITHFAFQLHHVWKHSQRTTFRKNRSTAPHLCTHSTSCPHFTPCTSHSNINFTSHYPIAPHIPHCISTIIPHHTAMSNMAPSNHSTSLGIPQPHFASSQHATILHMYHTIVPHRITTFRIWHCMT